MRQLRDALVHVKNTECNVSALGLECDSPELFVRCQWQKKKDRVSIIYLIYRFLHAFFFVGVTTWSLSDAAAPEERKYISTWAIYLTHWGITLCTVQAVVNLGLLVHQFVMEINGAEKYYTSMTVRYKVYWILHTTAVVVAIGITGSYFVAEYKPGQQTITALNLAVHAFNSILMIIDLLVVSHPFRLLHCYWPFCFVVIYFSFSAIYFLAGGTDKNNNKSIYTAVDWQKPGMTFLVILIGLLFVLFIHFLMWLLVLGRNKLGDTYANKYNAPANNQVQPA